MPAYPYDVGFQRSVLQHSFQDKAFAWVLRDVGKPEFFELDVHEWLFRQLSNVLTAYGEPPSPAELRSLVVAATRAGEIDKGSIGAYAREVEAVYGTQLHSRQFVLDRVVQFGRQEAVKAFYKTTGIDLVREEKYDELRKGLDEAASLGTDASDLGHFYFPETDAAFHERDNGLEVESIPTGITELDTYLAEGGLGRGELGIWMGPSNRGKSMALRQCSRRAIIGGCKVVDYTLEMRIPKLRKRYDASFAGVAMREIIARSGEARARVNQLGGWFGNSLLLKEYPTKTATVGTIRAHLRQLQQSGFVPDMVVVDYGDLLKAEVQRSERREELTEIFTSLRGIAGEFDLAMWTATQTNRGGFAKEIVTMEDIAEDIGKVNIADLIVSLCQTKDEKDVGRMRLFIAKNRDEISGIEIPIAQDLSRGLFYSKLLSGQY